MQTGIHPRTRRRGRAAARPTLRVTTALLAVAVALALAGCGDDGGGTDSAVRPGGSAGTSPDRAPGKVPAGARPSAGCDRAAGADGADRPRSGAPTEATIDVDGVSRRYLVSKAGTKPGQPAPVVVLLHGMGFTAEEFDRVTAFPERAAEAGMIVVTPQALGTPTMWRPAAQGPDPALIDAILEDLARSTCIDAARVHVAGFSVGAVLTTVYACARQDRIASIVTVTVETPAGCKRPMSILSFHGTADPVIPYGDRDQGTPGGGKGAEADMATWAATAGCRPTPTVRERAGGVTRLEWPGCKGGAEVVLFRIAGGGHEWPGGAAGAATPAGSGAPTGGRPVSATDEAIAFFGRHSL